MYIYKAICNPTLILSIRSQIPNPLPRRPSCRCLTPHPSSNHGGRAPLSPPDAAGGGLSPPSGGGSDRDGAPPPPLLKPMADPTGGALLRTTGGALLTYRRGSDGGGGDGRDVVVQIHSFDLLRVTGGGVFLHATGSLHGWRRPRARPAPKAIGGSGALLDAT